QLGDNRYSRQDVIGERLDPFMGQTTGSLTNIATGVTAVANGVAGVQQTVNDIDAKVSGTTPPQTGLDPETVKEQAIILAQDVANGADTATPDALAKFEAALGIPA